MENRRFQDGCKGYFGARLGLAVLAALVVLGVVGVASAAAVPLVGKDGKIHACYRVKGKPKGELRVVKGARTHCRKGERRVAWTVAGATGPQGPSGANGTDGSGGQTGSGGATGQQGAAGASAAALEVRVGQLTDKVETLEQALTGVTNSLCAQTATLTNQLNALTTAVAGISLTTLLAVVLNVPSLPAALPSYSCP